MNEIDSGPLSTKRDAHRLESGRHGITAQLTALGEPPVVVDRHGGRHGPAGWPHADVFWQGGQQDLLVADNQTRQYDAATPAQRRVLSAFAWGPDARPA
jgi:hypothetical protein